MVDRLRVGNERLEKKFFEVENKFKKSDKKPLGGIKRLMLDHRQARMSNSDVLERTNTSCVREMRKYQRQVSLVRWIPRWWRYVLLLLKKFYFKIHVSSYIIIGIFYVVVILFKITNKSLNELLPICFVQPAHIKNTYLSLHTKNETPLKHKKYPANYLSVRINVYYY